MPSKSGALPNTYRESLPHGDGIDSRRIQPIHRGLPESVSGFQDSVASSFKKFRDLFHLISLYANFIQRFAKVPKKPVEMPVV